MCIFRFNYQNVNINIYKLYFCFKDFMEFITEKEKLGCEHVNKMFTNC